MSKNINSPTVEIVSGEDDLKNYLIKRLEGVGCCVSAKYYKESIIEDSSLSSWNFQKAVEDSSEYFIWIMGSLGLVKETMDEPILLKQSLIKSLSKIKKRRVRCAFVFPYVERRESFFKTSELISLVRDAGFEKDILIVGDICYANIFEQISKNISDKDLCREYYPLFIEQLSERILKELFTLSEKRPKALISKKISISEVRKLIGIDDDSTKSGETSANFKRRRIKSKIFLDQNKEGLTKSLEVIADNINRYGASYEDADTKEKTEGFNALKKDKMSVSKIKKVVVVKKKDSSNRKSARNILKNLVNIFSFSKLSGKVSGNRIKFKFGIRTFAKIIIVVVVITFLSPMFFLKISEKLLSLKSFSYLENERKIESKIMIATPMVYVLQAQLDFFEGANLLENFYSDIQVRASLINKYKIFLENIIDFKKQSSLLLEGIIKEDVTKSKLKEIELDSRKISEEGAFLVGEITGYLETKESDVFFDNEMVDSVDSFRKLAFYNAELLSNAEEIFGFNEEKKYLLVFVDGSIVRPSGGFVREVALIDSSEGNIKSVDVYASDTIDGKMAGYALIPRTLYDYLGEESWKVEDSTWSTSYKESSQAILRFIKNSLNIDVDGVITISSTFIKDLQDWIDGDFVYEVDTKTYGGKQSSEYVIGSDINGILSQLITSLNTIDMSKGSISEFLASQMQRKNLLIDIFELNVSQDLNNLGWNDNYTFNSCGEYCFNDFLKMTDFEVSESSAANVRRSGYLIVNIEGGVVKRKYMLRMVNYGDQKYKAYLRLAVPQHSGFAPVEIADSGAKRKETLNVKAEDERKEGGLYIEIDPGDSKQLTFSWEGGFAFENNMLENYRLNLLKQPGVYEVDTNVKITHEEVSQVKINGKRFLTSDEVLLYNSSLLTDQVIELNF